jgi:hypothetical protein
MEIYFRTTMQNRLVFESGYHESDGAWEGIRLHEGIIAFLNLHLYMYAKPTQKFTPVISLFYFSHLLGNLCT